jgi:hypothetical protein
LSRPPVVMMHQAWLFPKPLRHASDYKRAPLDIETKNGLPKEPV